MNFSPDILTKAATAIQEGASYRDVEKQLGVPKSTIHRRIKKLKFKTMGGQTALSREEEQIFVDHLIVVSQWGFPFSKLDLRLLVKGYLEKSSRIVKSFKNNMPDDDWAQNFLKSHRNAITRRTCQNIRTTRAEMNKNDFIQYFENLKEAIKDIPPSNILNYDKTNLTDDPGSDKLIFKRGVKYPERIQNYSKGSISIMFCSTASGDMLEPYVVYKATNLWKSWTRGGPPRTHYNRSKSGWFDNVCFNDWFNTVIIPWSRKTEGPTVIIGDNLSSHFSPEIIRPSEKNDIHFICLVPNSTHLSQPLDAAFYGPLKRKWRTILRDWKIRNQSLPTLPKDSFPKLLKELVSSLNLENLKSGFRACRIYPMDPNEVLKRLPQTPEDTQANVSGLVIQQLQSMRSREQQLRRRRKRIQVEPGKSVTSADIESDKENNIGSDEEKSMEVEEFDSSHEEDSSDKEVDENVNPSLKLLPYSNVKEGDWVKVLYEGEVYVGTVLKKTSQRISGQMLGKTFCSWWAKHVGE